MLPDPAAPTATNAARHRVGPFDVIRDGDSLVLRFDDRGELSFRGCLVFVCLMLFVVTLGLLALVGAATAPPPTLRHALVSGNSPERLLTPPGNPFGVLWGVSLVAIVVGIPLFVRKTYQSPLTYTFRHSDDAFLRGKYRVTSLRRIEYLTLHEAKDPDDRYLYELAIVYGDGRQLHLHTGYDERDLMNLANEISVFVSRDVRWR